MSSVWTLSKMERVKGLAYYSHSLPVRSLLRLSSLTQKVIQTFCFILNALAFNMNRSLNSSPSS